MSKIPVKGISIAKWIKKPTIKNLKSAIQKAKQTFAVTPLGKIINKCPEVKPTPPPPPTPKAPAVVTPAKPAPPPPTATPPPKPPTVPRVECSIIRVNSICEHTPRKDNANYFLAVVPSRSKTDTTIGGESQKEGASKGIGGEISLSSSNKGDKIESTAIMNQNCGKHPIWKVLDEDKLVYDGSGKPSEKLTFEVLPPDLSKQNIPNILGLVWWLKNVKPRNYSIQCIGHDPSHRPITTWIAVYSPLESAITVSLAPANSSELESNGEIKSEFNKFDFIRKKIEDAVEVLAKITPNIKELKIEVLRGSLSLKNSWVEAPVFYKANWEAEISIHLDPLISIDGKCALTPSLIPSYISKWVDAYIYIGVKGEITANGTFIWKSGDYNDAKGTVEGAITISLGATAFGSVSGYKVVSFDASGSTKLSAECSLIGTVEPQITLEGKLKWDPLTAKIGIELLDGWVKFDKEWTLFEQKEILSGSYEFLSKS